jgi:hypothetical protein
MAGKSLVRKRLLCVLASLCFAVPVYLMADSHESPDRAELVASISQIGEPPVAVISPLPDAVSNGTWWNLSAEGSYDPDGIYIKSYLWEIEYGDVVEELYGHVERYKFKITGLYKIKLTVVDSYNNTGVDFTAVYSVPDSDVDGIPDWWEVKYFRDLAATAEQDPDGDGYSNIEEYVRLTSPLDADPREGIIEANWRYFLIAAIVVVAVIAVLYPRHRRKKKESERKKMEYAIEIQRALDED